MHVLCAFLYECLTCPKCEAQLILLSPFRGSHYCWRGRTKRRLSSWQRWAYLTAIFYCSNSFGRPFIWQLIYEANGNTLAAHSYIFEDLVWQKPFSIHFPYPYSNRGATYCFLPLITFEIRYNLFRLWITMVDHLTGRSSP